MSTDTEQPAGVQGAPWRTPAGSRVPVAGNVDPPNEGRVAEHQNELRTSSDGTGAGADEMAEGSFQPEPKHALSPVEALMRLADSGLLDKDGQG